MASTLTSRQELVTNTLLVAPTFSEDAEQSWSELIEAADPASANVLAVTYDGPDRVLDRWHRAIGDLPPKLGVLAVGEESRSATREAGGEEPAWQSASQVAIEAVSNPGDLTGLGVRISEYISDWSAERSVADPSRLVVDFDDISTLLQYADLPDAYRFLHIFTGRLEAVEAEGVFRLNRGAHDPETVAAIESLFDRVVEIDDDGARSVRSR